MPETKDTLSPIQDPSALERVTGSLGVGMVATGVAAIVGGPLAAMLPVLAQAFAAGRQRDRVNAALTELAEVVNQHADQIQDLTDQQFHVVSEVVEATIHTSQNEKLEYLKAIAKNVLQGASIKSHEAEWLARIIRDISADELKFLIDNHDYQSVAFANEASGIPEIRAVFDADPDLAAGSGLIALGILIPGKNTISDIGTYRFNPLSKKLVALVASSD